MSTEPRTDITFLDGFEARTLDHVDPGQTVLGWLRETEGRTGTKEGCAEGDCGACTVVLARLENGTLCYRAVNACILFMPQLDGAQLITVEHLKRDDGSLHPVQQALVDQHGSQCGFCTPGIVMSLFALSKAGAPVDRRAVNRALAGNLCRCTGYRPIVEAMGMVGAGVEDQFTERAAETIEALQHIAAARRPLTLTARNKRYVAPTNLATLAELCNRYPDAHLLAGGTDLGLLVTKQHRDLDPVIDLARVPELKRLDVTPTHVDIGATVTYREVQATIADRWPDFGRLICRIGAAQIQNAGTIGGNIANGSPIGDTIPALIALGATLVLQKNTRRRSLPLDEFHLGYRKTALEPGEFIVSIQIPLPPPDLAFRCFKVAKRFDQDISAVMAAFALERSVDGRVERIRAAFGGMAATPKRAAATERAMTGRPWVEATVEAGRAALDHDFQPLSDLRASTTYRRTVARNLLTKFFIETTSPTIATRVPEG